MPPNQYPEYPPKPSPFPDNSSRPFPNNPNSVYYTITMFSHSVSLMTPLVSLPAILAFCARADASLIRYHTQNPETTQLDERVETAKRLLSSSVAGLDNGIDVANSDDLFLNHVFSTPSERFEDDWQRLRESQDGENIPPYRSDSTSLNPQLLAVISGTWDGRMEVPPPSSPSAARSPLTYTRFFFFSVSRLWTIHVIARLPNSRHQIIQ